ncbi:MAG: hypothetical protein CVU39_15355 [Chloroflexi bacterium HGW-Chloroflexi-10]|nr:MAG: hypothetical protein CVU39_15355 [Chloroflexi bacterium HGW-Chloroflexi-10]
MKRNMILMIVIVDILSVACNLPASGNTNESGNNNPSPTNPTAVVEKVCFPKDSLPIGFVDSSDNQTISSAFDFEQIQDVFGQIFKDATIQSKKIIVSQNYNEFITCNIVAPLKPLEQAAFDVLLKQPDRIIDLIKTENIQISESPLLEQMSTIGNTRTAYRIAITNQGQEYHATIVVLRFEDSVYFYNYLSSQGSGSPEILINILTKLP